MREGSAAAAQLAQAGGSDGTPIGTVTAISGPVGLTHVSGGGGQIAVGAPVYLNDTVVTGPGGAIEIAFVDGTTFSLGADARMALDNLVYNPGGAGNDLDISVVTGAFAFITGSIAGAPGDGMSIDTPAATIGIRGTIGAGSPAPSAGGYYFTVFQGHFTVTNAAGIAVLDQPFETTRLSSRFSPPSEVVVVTPELASRLYGGALQLMRGRLQDFHQQDRDARGLLEEIVPAAGGGPPVPVEQAQPLPPPVEMAQVYDLATLSELLLLAQQGALPAGGLDGTTFDFRWLFGEFGNPNFTPVGANPDSGTVVEDAAPGSAAGNVLDNDRGANLQIAEVNGDPANVGQPVAGRFGTLTLDADGSYAYVLDNDDPDVQSLGEGERTEDRFTYRTSDGSVSTLAITVVGTNDAPAVSDDAYTVAQGGTLTIAAARGVLANDGDVDGDALSVAIASGPEHGRVTINADGSFTYQAAPGFDGTDSFTYAVSDGHGGTSTATVTVNVVDAVPKARDDTVSTTDRIEQTINLVIILDISRSMNDPAGPGGSATRLDLARDAITDLLAAYEGIADINIQIVDFADQANSSGWLATAAEANAYLADLQAGGGTSYSAAIEEAMAAYGAGLPPADRTEVYFLSDGEPMTGTSLRASGLLDDWESFIVGNGIENVFAVGVGAGIASDDADLADVAFPNGMPDNPEPNVIVVTDETQLRDTLVDTVPNAVSGNILANDAFGLDGRGNGGVGLLSIEVDGVTYAYDQASDQITNDGGLPATSGSRLVAATGLGGTLTIDFATGAFEYAPPDVVETRTETFAYTIVDGDGDLSQASLTVNITDSRPGLATLRALSGAEGDSGLAGGSSDAALRSDDSRSLVGLVSDEPAGQSDTAAADGPSAAFRLLIAEARGAPADAGTGGPVLDAADLLDRGSRDLEPGRWLAPSGDPAARPPADDAHHFFGRSHAVDLPPPPPPGPSDADLVQIGD